MIRAEPRPAPTPLVDVSFDVALLLTYEPPNSLLHVPEVVVRPPVLR